MATVTPLPAVSLRTLAAANLQSLERSPGCHVTPVIDAMMRAYGGRSRPKDFSQLDSENWQEAGFVWEDILSRTFAHRAAIGHVAEAGITRWRPGELAKDGIAGSPDALACDAFSAWVEEYKCTWKSAKGFDLYDKRYLPWLLQIMAYCWLANVVSARLYVLHMNGGYEQFIPAVQSWQLDFTTEELAANWRSLVKQAQKEGWV